MCVCLLLACVCVDTLFAVAIDECGAVVTCFTIGAVTARVVTVVLSGCLLPTLCLVCSAERRVEEEKTGREKRGRERWEDLSVSLPLSHPSQLLSVLAVCVEEMRTHASVSAYNIQLLVSMCTSSFSSSVLSRCPSTSPPASSVIGYKLRLSLVQAPSTCFR